MSSRCCCERGALAGRDPVQTQAAGDASRTFVRRCADLLDWLLPSAVLALLPKCPMCLAAWIGAATGLGISVPDATQLRWLLLTASATALTFAAAKRLRRVA